MTRPPRVVHLDDIEAIPGPGTLTWHPVRAHLGLRAFGTNAYTGEVGDDVVEPHDEDPDLAHEELYFVARGRATFTLDGETFDAPPGTYVFVPDPATHRHAVAQEAGTTVLSFGGPPTFEPSAWEWMFRAVALTDSDPAAARAIVDDGLEKHPESPGMRVALARVLLAEGDEAGARAALADAIERQADVEDYIRQDAALQRLL
jgi:mannose-6-phosphate isomerase-like protein (cupin superfamily)